MHAPLSTTAKIQSKERTAKEILDDVDARYEEEKQHFESHADQALLSMLQNNNGWIRRQAEALGDLGDIPWEGWKEAGVNVEEMRATHEEFVKAMIKLQKLTKESRAHTLDLLHEDYPAFDPYPFKKYQDEWSKRKRVEQEQELRRLDAEIATGDATFNMLAEKARELFVNQYGQEFVDKATQATNSFEDTDFDIDDDDSRLLDSLEEPSSGTNTTPAKQGAFMLDKKPVAASKTTKPALSIAEQFQRLLGKK